MQLKSTFRNLKPGIVFLFFAFAIVGCGSKQIHHTEWKKYFVEYSIPDGCIVIYDKTKNEFHDYNTERCGKRLIPASTFKILISLVALENKVVPDENFVLKYDSTEDRENVMCDLDLKSALRLSANWFYFEMLRRIGIEKMNGYIKQVHYGNENTGKDSLRFWVNSELRISPDEQIEFLQHLNENKLPFKQKNIDIVKKILLLNDTLGVKLYGKTGWANYDGKSIGWFIGWAEKGSNVYYFATNVEADENNLNIPLFDRSRKEITKKIFQELGFLK